MAARAQRWPTTSAPVVVGTAAFNALGFDAAQTWAFWRAETTPFTESPFHAVNGVKAPMAINRTLPLRCFGADRMWLMVRRCLDQLGVLGELMRHRGSLLLGVPERLEERELEPQLRRLKAELGAWLTRYLPEVAPRVVPRGHASMASVLLDAAKLFEARVIDFAVVGAVDTYYDPRAISTLNRQRRLFDTIAFDTILPGEGAAMLVICRPDLARQLRLEAQSRVEVVAEADETATMFTDLPCAAKGLGEAMRAVTQFLKGERRQLEWVLGDCTNEVYRTHEFGLALPRAIAPGGLDTAGRDFFAIAADSLDFDFLPECFGELGAASMATGAVIASEAMRRGHPTASSCMIFGSSLGPTRGALLISRTNGGGA